MIAIKYEELYEELRERGFPFYDRPYDLNLVGVRNSNRQSGLADDTFMVAYRDAAWVPRVVHLPITTDPSPRYLEKPINAQGTAILAPGHYPGMWKPGLHRGKYRALVQVGPCTVIRDANRDTILDWDAAKRETGYFGINLHHGKGVAASAGCQVLPEPEDLKTVLALVDAQMKAIGSARVSYTLLFAPELRRFQ